MRMDLGRGAVLGVLGMALVAAAQEPGPSLTFSLDREGAGGAHYTVTVSDRGVGVYQPKEAVPAAESGAEAPATELQESPKTLRVSPAIVKKVFAAVPLVEGGRCETHSKGIAKTGVKTLHYVAAKREAQCTYNYSDDDRVNEATMAFEGLGETMQYGQRLQAKLRFDRLGLDTELQGLESEAAAGRALEVGNIAPVLNAIAQDERVMERVRRRAEKLLGSAVPDQTAAGSAASAP